MKTADFAFRLLIPFKGGKLFDGNDYWAETCFALFMLKVYFPNREHFNWFWYTRYQMPLSIDKFIKKHIEDDKNFIHPIEKSKKDYVKDVKKNLKENEYRCIYIRMSVASNKATELKQLIEDIADEYGYRAVNFEKYDLVTDLGGDRFAPPRFNDKKLDKDFKILRANEIAKYMFAVCKMFFWCLQKNSSGWYVPENNTDRTNRTTKSTMEACHHMFCNITDVPLFVFEKDGEIGTTIYPNKNWEDDDNLSKKEVKF